MPVRARIKFEGSIPFEQEHRLCRDFGFTISARNGKEWVIFEKKSKPKKFEVLVNGELPEHIQNELNARCDRVVNMFLDPELHMVTIKIRLNNIKLTLPPLQQKFVEEWIARNLDTDQ